MKITLEMDNLQSAVEGAINANITNIVEQEVDALIKAKVNESAKLIEDIVNEKIIAFVNEYFKTVTITVGGGWNDPVKTYGIEEYIKLQIAEKIETQQINVKDRYGNTKTVSFNDYCKQMFDVDKAVERTLNDFMNSTAKSINQNINDMFNDAARRALSESVLNLLSKNETFQNMQDSIKCIANRD